MYFRQQRSKLDRVSVRTNLLLAAVYSTGIVAQSRVFRSAGDTDHATHLGLLS